MTDNDNTLQGNIDREIQQLTKVFPQIFKLKSEGNLSCAKLDYDTAITLYTQAMVIIKNSEDQIKDKYADVLDKYEDFKVLLHSFNKENVALHSNLALCYAKKGMFEKSIEYDKKVISIFLFYFYLLFRLLLDSTNNLISRMRDWYRILFN